MAEPLVKREIIQQRIQIGSEKAWVSREGGSVKISYGYAGRFTKEDQRFYADDIRRLAQFVADTDQ